VIVWTRAERAAAIEGILLLQVANLCFAAGQVLYRRVMGRVVLAAERDGRPAVTDHGVFAVLYLGAAGVALVPAVVSGIGVDAKIGMAQVVTLLYLGIVPSACCFYLWNAGARRVPAGALAAMNNAKLPLAVLVSLVFFGESANLTRLVAGGAVLLAAVWLGARGPVSRREPV
jgi:drug/metabolite transporter (DMT)-like permease